MEKILKIFLFISVKTYRWALKKNLKTEVVVIDNFDGNIKMKVDPSRSMGSALYWTGFHEFREFIFLHRYLKEAMVFVDVGANQGEYSLFAGKRLTKGRVLAFEPLPSMRAVLKENIELNGFKNIDTFDFGLSNREDTLQIHDIGLTNEGLATFYLGDRISNASFSVKLTALDIIFKDNNLTRLDFIKMDIEGGELKALQGSIECIQKYHPVLMVEINEQTYQAAGYRSKDIMDFFDSISYQAYEIKKRGRLKRCNSLPTFGNIIFMPK